MPYTPPLPEHVWYEFLDAYVIPGGCGITFALKDPDPEYEYTPRGCANVWFEFKDEYIAPDGCNIIFRVGESPDVDTFGFTPSNVEFLIEPETMESYSGMMVIPETVNIVFELEDSVLDPLWPIEMQSMEIGLEIGDSGVEILPDMIISGMSISTEIGEASMRKTEDHHLPSRNSSGIKRIPWKDGSKVEKKEAIIWDTPTSIKIDTHGGTIESETPDVSTKSPWKSLDALNHTVHDRFKCDEISVDVSYLSGFRALTNYDVGLLSPWQNAQNVFTQKFAPYRQPEPKDRHNTASYDEPTSHDEHLKVPYKAPKPKDTHVTKPWGPFSYYTLCSEDYKAPDGCGLYFTFPNKYELIPNICAGIEFHVNNWQSADPRCEYNHAHSGVRDPYIWVDPENKNLIYPRDLGVYRMLNVVLVEEVITGTPIEVLHVDAKIDMSSWLWSFNVTVASKCFLDIIKPVDGILGNIKITMNGHVFFCTVEGWSENRAFGSDAWTISGRSPSLLFGAPICEPKTNIITDGKQGSTIFDDFMIGRTYQPGWPFTSWIADFSAYTPSIENPYPTQTGFQPSSAWYLPANTVSYSDQRDIDVMKELANSIGAYIQTSPTTSNDTSNGQGKLMIKPRFAYQPWNWKSDQDGIIWKTLNEAQCVEIGRSNDVRTKYEAINVMGENLQSNSLNNGAENHAIFSKILKTGIGEGVAVHAPMETSPYVTTPQSAVEKGRSIIGASGDWVLHTLRIGIVCSNDDLFEVGDMLSVMERGTPWFGQVTGVQIAAVTAGTGFAIEQTIEVEEYVGD